ncbi:MAG: metallophosphoesterase [Algicola sp.]|nr:metallophosphoesterase [Algicola sp.]
MKVQLLSDLHVEFGEYRYQSTDADVVILAGDIHVGEKGIDWAGQIKDKPVIYVLGNHEYYRNTYPKLIDKLKEKAAGSNIHVLENDRVTVDGVNFFGCTLWTDFALFGDPRIAGYHCQQMMNDCKRIKRMPTYSKMRSVDIALIHRQSLNWLGDALSQHQGEKNVVVSHHGPSIESIPEKRRKELTSAGYVSDLCGFIEGYKPNVWVHGHLHTNSDYQVGDCRVLSNPRGYTDGGNPGFDGGFCFDV